MITPPIDERGELSRRAFLGVGVSCAAHVGFLMAGAPLVSKRLFANPLGRTRQQEAWGRLEEIADGVWAVISTPLEDGTTLCNGGLIAGRDGVLAVEAFASERGAAWLGERARDLTGRWPTHAVITHYHGDHSGGVAGYRSADENTSILTTRQTRDRVLEQDTSRDTPPPARKTEALQGAELVDPNRVTDIELGGRTVHLHPRAGHTASDITVEVSDPSVVFCGDLVWNGMFPNYVDARPSTLARDVAALVRERETIYVPGHGSLADADALAQYQAVLGEVEAAARRALETGTPMSEAAESFQISASLGEWFMFSPRYYERALGAWERELNAG